MARFKIYSKDGQTVRYEGCPRYNGTYLKVSYLEFSSIASPTPIAWQVGDYVDYPRTGLRYTLRAIPAVKKTEKPGRTGDAFVYQNVQFMAQTQDLVVTPFIDLVPEDNGVHFSTQSAVSTFENAYGIAARIQACLDDLFPGAWDVEVYESLEEDFKTKISEAVDFSIDGGTCLEACDRMYETWGIGWTHYKDSATGKDVLLFGRPNTRTSDNTSAEFVFGPGEGLTAIKRSVANADEIGTRLRVFGSSRNMLPAYYNGLDIYNAESVDIQNLMIPPSKWGKTDGKPDARKAYLQASDEVVEQLGLIPRTHYFDGSDGEEIFPSLEGVTIGDIRAAKEEMQDEDYVPSAEIYPSDSERADEIKAATNPEDDGYSGGSDGSKYKDTKIISFPGVNRDAVQTVYDTSKRYTIFSGVNFSDDGLAVTVETGMEGYIDDSNGFIRSISLKLRLVTEEDTQYEQSSVVDVPTEIENNGTRFRFSLPEITLVRLYNTPVSLYLEMSVSVDYPSSQTDVRTFYVTLSGYDFILGQTSPVSGDFSLALKQIGFDISQRAPFTSDGIARVYMKDGMNAGRSFYVKTCSFDSAGDQWLLGMYRTEDESTGMRYPNSQYPVKPGDHFVLLDIAMPELYIGIAQQRLYEKGLEMLNDISRVKPYYEPEVDAIVMAKQSRTLREGMYMRLSDADVSGAPSEYVLIDTLTINEGEAEIPTYKVTLREYKKKTFQETTSAAIDNLSQKASVEASGKPTSSVCTYGSLTDKPSIDGVTLTGAMRSYDDIGLLNKTHFEVVNVGTEESPILALRTKYGIVSESFISARGSDPEAGGGASGVDMDAVWDALAAGTSEQINASHIPALNISKITGLQSALDSKLEGITKAMVEAVLTGTVTSHNHDGRYAPLSGGLIPSQYLPSYVDDVVEYASMTAFPATGEAGKIYVALDTNLTYRWGGSGYVEISPSLALGHTSSTAYPGDEGAANASAIQTLQGYFSGGAAKRVEHALTINNDGGSPSASAKTYNGSAAVTINIPTTLPASDVYDWAKQPAKPSYNFSEIGNKPTTLDGYGITDGVNEVIANNNLSGGVSGHDLTIGIKSGYALPTSTQIALWDKVGGLFDVDEDGNVYVKDNRGFYGNSFISARGSDPEAGASGGGGLDEDALWDILGTAGTEKIDISHIPELSLTDVTGLEEALDGKLSGITGQMVKDALGYTPYDAAAISAASVAYAATSGTAGKVAHALTVKHDGGSSSASAKTYNGSAAVTVTIPTTLPASDVYAWAKATTKPSYTWGEIGGKPSVFTPAAHTHPLSDISDLHASWDALLKAAPSAYVTRWPAWGEVTGKPSSFTPAEHTHVKADITDFPTSWAWSAITGKPSTLAGYGITDGVNSVTASGGLSASVSGHKLTVGVASGYAVPTSAQIGAWNLVASLFGVDSDGNVYVKGGKGFYGTSFVSARGSDPEAGQGGGTGVDMDAVWDALAAGTTEKINVSHLSATDLASLLTGAGYKLTDTIYTLPKATVSALGGIKAAGVRTSGITTTQGGTTSGRYYGVELDSNGKAFVNVPWVNTTYSLSSFGITATAAEINKLDGLATTAKELGYVHGVTSAIQTQLNAKANASALASYLPLSGGTMTGDIAIPSATAKVGGITVPAAGTFNTFAAITDLSNYKTFIGTAYVDDVWQNVISVRHRNGNGDGSKHGIYLRSQLNLYGSLYWRKQYAEDWGEELALLDSSNYTNYTVTKTGVGASGTWPISVSGTATYATVLSNNANTNVLQHLKYRVVSGQTSLVGSNAVNGAWCLPTTGGDAKYGNGQILRFGWAQSYYTDLHTGPNEIGSNSGLQFRQVVAGAVSSLGWRTLLDTANYAGTLDTRYLLKSAYTASDILAKLKTVDGSGSGLDADLLDGTQKSGLLTSVASTAATNLSVTVGGTVKSVADLYATYLDGYNNYNTITVGGDADTYYPVVIQGPSVYYPALLLNITRAYNETAPDSWNTSTHKGGLTLCILWNSSRYWDGNGGGNTGTTNVLMLEETYCTMVGGMTSSTSGLVVWLRGGTATYHIYSDRGVRNIATVYLNGFTDSQPKTFSPTKTPSSILAYQRLSVTASAASKLATARTLWGRPFDGTANVSGDMTGVGSISMTGALSAGSSITSGEHLLMKAATGRFIFNSTSSGFMMSMESGNFQLMSHNIGSYVARLVEVDMSGNVGIKAAPASGYALNVAGAGYFSSLLRANAGIQIGGTSDIGWYLQRSRITAGTQVARGVNVGSLLVSNAWADYTKVPANGIYAKGAVLTDGYLQVGSGRLRWDAANNALYVEKFDGTPCGLYSKGYMSARGSDQEASTGGSSELVPVVTLSKLTVGTNVSISVLANAGLTNDVLEKMRDGAVGRIKAVFSDGSTEIWPVLYASEGFISFGYDTVAGGYMDTMNIYEITIPNKNTSIRVEHFER